jgi:hypothetical protein
MVKRISVKFSTGGLHLNLPREFNFGLNWHNVTPTLLYTNFSVTSWGFSKLRCLSKKKLLHYTRANSKIRGLTLLLRVGTSWRCGDRLYSEVPSLASDHFLQSSTHLSKTYCRPFATSFRRIVQQAVLTSWCGWKGGHLRIHWISSRGRPTRGDPPAGGSAWD